MSGQGPTAPSARAWELVAGAYDIHVHAAPDVIERRASDVELAARFGELRLGGLVLKSHYTMTAERALAVRAASGADVQGGITLNWAVGGINATAVEVCARVGGRFVWMPTIDAAVTDPSEGAIGRPPAWLEHNQLLSRYGVTKPPLRITTDDGRLTPEVRLVLEVIAAHQMVLCTGHLDRNDVMALVDAARNRHVSSIVVTHPDAPAQRLTAADQRYLAERGCLLERCFGTAHSGRATWQRVMSNIRAAGPENSVVSSDLGQVMNPPVEYGVPMMADRLLAAGFSEREIRTMTVANSRRLCAY
jgi:hypothetical protein